MDKFFSRDNTDAEIGATQKKEGETETAKRERDQCTWSDDGAEWRIGVVESNFRKITTRHGERFVVNINVAGEKDAVWLESKVRGGSKQAGFLEAVGCVYKDGDRFNPTSILLEGIQVLCLWGLIKAKGKVLRDGVIRYKKMGYPKED